ncbi:hypothetical protein ACTG9Q_32900, partial [Actinokineospora sp. 24-640]
MSELTSPQLARMVSYARQAKSDAGFTKRHLVNALAKASFAVGVVNLLTDLSDPKSFCQNEWVGVFAGGEPFCMVAPWVVDDELWELVEPLIPV